MAEEQHSIDEIFRQSLGDYREAPPVGAWDAIEQKLDGNQEKPRPVFWRWPWIMLILLLMIGGGWMINAIYNQHTDHKQADKTVITNRLTKDSATSPLTIPQQMADSADKSNVLSPVGDRKSLKNASHHKSSGHSSGHTAHREHAGASHTHHRAHKRHTVIPATSGKTGNQEGSDQDKTSENQVNNAATDKQQDNSDEQVVNHPVARHSNKHNRKANAQNRQRNHVQDTPSDDQANDAPATKQVEADKPSIDNRVTKNTNKSSHTTSRKKQQRNDIASNTATEKPTVKKASGTKNRRTIALNKPPKSVTPDVAPSNGSADVQAKQLQQKADGDLSGQVKKKPAKADNGKQKANKAGVEKTTASTKKAVTTPASKEREPVPEIIAAPVAKTVGKKEKVKAGNTTTKTIEAQQQPITQTQQRKQRIASRKKQNEHTSVAQPVVATKKEKNQSSPAKPAAKPITEQSQPVKQEQPALAGKKTNIDKPLVSPAKEETNPDVTTNEEQGESEATHDKLKDPAASVPSMRQFNMPTLSLTVFGGYEWALQKPAPNRIAGVLQLLWHFSPSMSIGLQPAYRFGNLSSQVINKGGTFYTPHEAIIDSFTTVDTAIKYHYYISRNEDSISAPSVVASGTIWDITIPLIFHYQVPMSKWHFYGGPSFSFGGRIKTTSNDILRSYEHRYVDSIIQATPLPASYFEDPFELSRKPRYNPNANQPGDPSAIRIGYLAGFGYEVKRFLFDVSIQQQLTGFSNVNPDLKKVYTSPSFRINLGYRIFKTGRNSSAEKGYIQRL